MKTSAQKRASSLAYYRANAKAISEARRAQRAADPDTANAKARAARAANPAAARERDRRYAQRHPEKLRAKLRRRVLRRYGLTPGDFALLVEKQRGCCAICEAALPTRTSHQHVDHCHATGRVRGVLCNHCNLMIGHAKENLRTLARAIAYLEEGPSS